MPSLSCLSRIGCLKWGLAASSVLGASAVALRADVAAGLWSRWATVLEARFRPADLTDGRRVAGFIVLGGSPARARRAVDLARRHPEARVILSGPGPAEVAILRGASELAGRLHIDRRARTTYENALYSKSLAEPRAQDRWVVVTSAVHMPRAIGAFRRVGFAVEPSPVYDTPSQASHLVPVVRHELLGLAYYLVSGRSESLWPGPDA